MRAPVRRYALGLLAAIAATIASGGGDASAGLEKRMPVAEFKTKIAEARALTDAKALQKALPLWVKLAGDGPDALEPAAQAGRLTAELEGTKAALKYCSSFLAVDRASQALACGKGAPALTRDESPSVAQFWLDATAALPVIQKGDVDDLRTTRPDLGRELRSIDECWLGKFKPLQADYWPGGLDPHPSFGGLASDALYLRLAESTEDPQVARCLLSVAAGRCMHQRLARRLCEYKSRRQ